MKIYRWTVHIPVARLLVLLAGCAVNSRPSSTVDADRAKAQITVLYEVFGKTSAMTKDWGYGALVEYAGKRILFDTSNDPDIFVRNVRAKGIDLSKLTSS
jgi:7,8-dihydropterin-6-yl-methyl-4-(beta-D-ribofuranosyl)aminobenzene 5'-phosphate synthase